MNFKIPDISLATRQLNEMNDLIRRQKEIDNGFASVIYEQLVKEIMNFDKKLDQTQEVGVRLVSYGQTIQFHITALGYQNPYLIYFYGELDDKTSVQLVQHVTQISFVLLSMKRLDPEKPKQPIGFRQV